LPDNNYSYSYDVCRLRLHGFKVFLDQHELQTGDHLTSQIKEAIQTASIHVAIFSVGYADSKWCLEELVQMLESGATIIPVFYDVKPTQLRWTRGENGVYAKYLRKLEKKKYTTLELMKRSRDSTSPLLNLGKRLFLVLQT
jgi:hypothetical protein